MTEGREENARCPYCAAFHMITHCGYNIVECGECGKRWDISELPKGKDVAIIHQLSSTIGLTISSATILPLKDKLILTFTNGNCFGVEGILRYDDAFLRPLREFSPIDLCEVGIISKEEEQEMLDEEERKDVIRAEERELKLLATLLQKYKREE